MIFSTLLVIGTKVVKTNTYFLEGLDIISNNDSFYYSCNMGYKNFFFLNNLNNVDANSRSLFFSLFCIVPPVILEFLLLIFSIFFALL